MCLKLVLSCMLSGERIPKVLQYILLIATIDVGVDDAPHTLLLVPLHCFSVV
jgi:hypothetical protein